MNRFFTADICDGKAYLAEEDAYHLKNVLRAREGDMFEICDGVSKEFTAKLSYIDKKSAVLDIVEEINICRETRHKYVLCQGIPKGSKTDDVVRHMTELGVSEYYPVISERINIKNISDYDKTDRLQRIVNEAAKQAKRTVIPKVNKPVRLEDIIKIAPENALKIIAWEEEAEVSLKAVIEGCKDENEIWIMVGPEGGLSASEVREAKKFGWRSVTLGKRILRTETAPLALVAAAAVMLGDME